ncbi:DUF5677 domain-containing protein [Mammaliicoccus sciuri]
MVEKNYHLKSTLQGHLLNVMMKKISDNLSTDDGVTDILEKLFLRKISQESIVIKDNLKGAVIPPLNTERIRPKSPKMTPIIIRNVYETYVYWKFFVNSADKNYYFKAYFYEESLLKQDIIYEDFEGEYPFLKVENTSIIMEEIIRDWKQLKRRGVSYPKWYNLKEGPRSFAHMNRILKLEEHFDRIYGFCSKLNHGMGLSNELLVKDDKLYLNATYSIHPEYEKYLFFLTSKLIEMINTDVLLSYKDKVSGLEEVYNNAKEEFKIGILKGMEKEQVKWLFNE